MTINSQQVYPVPYQWRRVLTLSSRRDRADRRRLRAAIAPARDRALPRLPAAAAAARLLPAGRAGAAPPARAAPRARRAAAVRATMPTAPAATSTSASPPSTSIGNGTPPLRRLAATVTGVASPARRTVGSTLLVCIERAVDQRRRACRRRRRRTCGRPASATFLPCARRDRRLHRRADVVLEARVDRAQPSARAAAHRGSTRSDTSRRSGRRATSR